MHCTALEVAHVGFSNPDLFPFYWKEFLIHLSLDASIILLLALSDSEVESVKRFRGYCHCLEAGGSASAGSTTSAFVVSALD